jgi:hypothetical protein
MQIEIISVEVENKGKYRVARVNFKDSSGKVDGKNIMSFTFKEVFKTLSESKQGDVFNVKSVKNDKGYWDWTEVEAAGKNSGAKTTSSAVSGAVRGNYETPEERARRQVYIVRQSSLSAAIDLAKANGAEAPITEADVIESAKIFEAYVFDIRTVNDQFGAPVQEGEVS